ncbi:TIGR02594 family protein [Hyphomicrobium sp.]|uniref:TIGR02594 family protein n=1 Tax=Hyphomicrobium sp. TaxID=82 RepID=UPI003F71B5E1
MESERWLQQAWREFGQAERAGRAENARIVAMFRDAGNASIVRDEVAWCAAFCGACLERAGIRSTRSLMARSYLAWGEAIAEPRMGAVAVFSRGNDPSLGHVGFWLGESDGSIVLLGGNQVNAVSVVRYPKSRLLGLRWPANIGAAAEPAPQAKDDGFAHALDHILEMEGGFTDDPHDPGGPTNLGVTLAVFAAWRKTAVSAANRARLIRDLKAIDRDTVHALYRSRYWEAAHCDALPEPIAFMQFDAAVNHGVGTAIRCLQEALGVSVDGEFGPETRAAAGNAPMAAALDAYAAIRERRYRALSHFWRFGRGWLRRVDITRTRAAALDTSNPEQGDTDMNLTPSMPSDGKWWGHSLTIWGTIVTVLSSVLPALAPVTGIDVTPDLIQSAGRGVVETVQAVGALVGTLLTIYGRVRADRPIQRSILKPKG